MAYTEAMNEVISDLDLLIKSDSKIEKFGIEYVKIGDPALMSYMPLGVGPHKAKDVRDALQTAINVLGSFGFEIVRVYYPRFDG